MEIQRRQDLRNFRKVAHVVRQGHALEATPVAVLADPAVVGSRSSSLQCPSRVDVSSTFA